MTVTLELEDDDLEYFRSVMRRVRHRNGVRSPDEVAAAASREVARLRSTARSRFILRRIDRVDRLIAMLEDPQWQLPETGRRRVLEGLAYVAEAHDLVPDDVPVLGLLDDAIMLELLLRDLQHELDAYEEFDAYRREESARRGGAVPSASVSCQDWLDSRREALHARIHERRERELAQRGGGLELIDHF
jgi:uncharacterized membrane protein YkvA (DUF1232 family)